MTAWVSGDLATQTRKTRQPIFDLLRFFNHSRLQVGAKHTRITALVFARSGWVLSQILADSCGAVRCGAVRCGDSCGPGPILRPVAADLAFPTHADHSHPPAGDHRVAAPRICCMSTDTRRWPGDDRHPVQASVQASVHRSEPGPDFVDTQYAFGTLQVHRARGVGRLWSR